MGDERYVQVRERAEAYAAWYEKERVTAHITENCREEAKQILAQADRLMAHTFSFEDRWDMEPCREPFTLKEMIWDRSPNGDPEWIFMLNRHEYMNKLLIAGWLTGDTSYAEKLKWFLLHWIQANPAGRQKAGEPVPGSSGCRAYFFQKQLGGGQPFYLPEMRSPWKRARTCGFDPYIALLQRPARTGGQRQVLLCGGRTAAPVFKERPGPQCMRYRRRIPWKAQGFMGV